MTLIFSIGMFLLAALAVFLGVLKGKKYTWVYSATRIAVAIVSVFLSVLLARLFAKLIGNALYGVVQGVLPTSTGSLFEEVPSIALLIKILVFAVISPVLFACFFSILYNVLNIFGKMIARALVKKLPAHVTGIVPQTEQNKENDKKEEADKVKDEADQDEEKDENKDNKDNKKAKKPKRVRNAELRVKGKNPAGMICGGVCALLLFFIGFAPAIGTELTAYRAVGALGSLSSAEQELSPVTDVMDASVNNLGAKGIRFLGGDALYNGLTTYRADGQKIRLYRETEVIGATLDALSVYSDPCMTPQYAATVIRDIEKPLSKSVLIPMIGSEFVDAASASWDEGKAFHGVNPPSNGAMGDIVRSTVTALKDSDVDTFREELGTIVGVVANVVEYDVLSTAKSDPISVAQNEEMITKVMEELLTAPRLYVLVSDFLDLGIDTFGDKLGMCDSKDTLYGEFCEELKNMQRLSDAADTEAVSAIAEQYRVLLDSYGLEADESVLQNAAIASADPSTDMIAYFAEQKIVSAESMPQKSVLVSVDMLDFEPVKVVDAQKEAASLASALAKISQSADRVTGESFEISAVMSDFGPALDVLSTTETVGKEKSAQLLHAVLQSDKVTKEVGFSVLEATEIADKISENAERGSYAEQMHTLGQTVEILKDSKNGSSKGKIKEMLNDLTPASASTMQTMMKPSVMKEQGVPEKNAQPVSNMMSDMFGNLSTAKDRGMSDEQIEKESAAVNNVTTMAMNAGDSNGSTFGEGSATGTSAQGFVDEIMDSEVVSQTVLEQVYVGEESEPKNDPLLTERNMNETEQAELLDAINNKWNALGSDGQANEENQKKLIAIGALLNVPLVLDGNAFVVAP